MLLVSLTAAFSIRDALPQSTSVSSMQHGIRYARSRRVKTTRNTTRPRSMYSFLVSRCIESRTVPQEIIAINRPREGSKSFEARLVISLLSDQNRLRCEEGWSAVLSSVAACVSQIIVPASSELARSSSVCR